MADHTILSDPEDLAMQEACGTKGMPPAQILLGPEKLAVPRKFLGIVEKVRDMEVRPDDVWLVTFPKCGRLV